jgi:NADPH2:quinone reductase
MKAIVCTRVGGPGTLELREVPEPKADAAGDVIVEIEAAGVNFADTMQTAGTYPGGPRPPYTPGLEFAGRIKDNGERVMGFTQSGAYAQQIATPRASLLRIPEDWSAEEAAAFPVNYFTAYFAYWMAGMLSGEKKTVLIHAVAGGVGTAAVEIGQVLGLEMYGTSSSDEKLARASELGLQHPINYKKKSYEEEIARLTEKRGVDAAFEMLGGEHTASTTRCLAEMGRLIVYGMATGKAPQFDFMTMFQRNISAQALWLMPLIVHAGLVRMAWMRLSEWIASGELRPVVGTTLPLEKAAEAHTMLLERRNYGKVVLVP